MRKILIFDIDGTLLLTGGSGKIAFEKTFEELFGIPESWGDLLPDGKTDPGIIKELAQNALGRSLEKNEYESICARYTAHCRSVIQAAPHFRLMAGVKKLLETLAGREDILLGIGTGNLEEVGWLKLVRGGIRDYFEFGGFGSDSSDRSEILRIALKRAEKKIGGYTPRKHILVIGDTPHDIRGAQKLGLRSIAVATGSFNETGLLAHQPTYFMQDLTDIQSFLNLL